MKKTNDFPSKKDLVYWILLLTIISIAVIVWLYNDPGKFNTQISLAGTLLSIALAVIAIIFSIIQSSNVEQLSSMAERVNELVASNNSLTQKLHEQIERTNASDKKTQLFQEVVKEVQNMKEPNGDEIKRILLEKYQEVEKLNKEINNRNALKKYVKNFLYNSASKYGNGWYAVSGLETSMIINGSKLFPIPSEEELETILFSFVKDGLVETKCEDSTVFFKLKD